MEIIEVMGRGRFSLGILIMVMLVLDTSQAGPNGSLVTKELSGAGTAIIGDNMEVEFLMDSEISKKLAGTSSYVTEPSSLIDSEPVVNCGRGDPYTPCVHGVPNHPRPPSCPHGAIYNRNCKS
ncbi:hypothetical protein PTKIN_Ptkin15bG0177600 [Pterospermum kingtungense]